MSTHRSTWKRRERDAARLFGAERQPLSGASGRLDRTQSDLTYGRLFSDYEMCEKQSTMVRYCPVHRADQQPSTTASRCTGVSHTGRVPASGGSNIVATTVAPWLVPDRGGAAPRA
jgi:hypothetical protein